MRRFLYEFEERRTDQTLAREVGRREGREGIELTFSQTVDEEVRLC